MYIKKRLKTYLKLTILFVSISLVFASQAFSLTANNGKTDKHFLWEIRSKQNIVYILGSLHVFKPEFYPLSDVIESAYNKSTTIVFEADSKSMESPETMAFLKTAGFYPQGDSLKKNISSETYELLQKKVNDLQLNMANFDQLKPWLCAVTISAMELVRNGYDPAHGIDAYFAKKTNREGKRTLFLETAEFQLNLFSGMSNKTQALLLKQTLKELEIINEMALEIITAWKEGNIEKINSIIQEGMKDYPELYDVLFVKRNERWVRQIDSFLNKNEPTFVIVGSGHLVGEGNVVELLRAKGYEVKQR